MIKAFFAILILLTVNFVPSSNVFAATDCRSIGAIIYTTDQARRARDYLVIGQLFNLEISYPKIKPGSIYRVTLSQGAVNTEDYNITATERGKISSLGWKTSTSRIPDEDSYYFTFYSIDGDKKTEICQTDYFGLYRSEEAAARAGARSSITAVDCSKPGSNCTGGKGMACNLSDGSPISNTTAERALGTTGIYTAIGCIPSEPKKLIEDLLKYGTFAAGGIAFLIMIIASLQMITAEGNPESLKNARDKFYSAIIGLLLIIFSVLLMQVIGVDILGLPGFGRA